MMAAKRDWNEENRKGIERFRANGGKIGKTPHILLMTTGAKSGLERVNPLHYSTDGARIIVMASKGGSASHPDWYLNLVAHPEVTVELGSERFRARDHGARRGAGSALCGARAGAAAFRRLSKEDKKRQIPVIILLQPVQQRLCFP